MQARRCASHAGYDQRIGERIAAEHEFMCDIVAEVLAESINEVIDQVVMLNKRLQTELWNLVKTQLGDLRARVDGVLPDTKSALRVARERADEVSELPNPPPPRRAIN